MNYEKTQCERCENKTICKFKQDYLQKHAQMKKIEIPIGMPFQIDFKCNMYRETSIMFNGSGSYMRIRSK